MLTDKCSICLNMAETTKKLEDVDENNIKWSMKLQYVVPEVEWQGYYSICGTCIKDLKACCVFKELCLSLLNAKSETKTLHFKEDYDSDVPMVSEPVEEDEKDVFICYHCDKSFDDIDLLTEHIGKEHNHSSLRVSEYKSSRKCLHCSKTFTNDSSLEEHTIQCDVVRRHTQIGKKEHECDKCKQNYSSKDKLRQHKKRCTVEFIDSRFRCMNCKTSYKHLKALLKHKKLCFQKEIENTLIFCEDCDEYFKSHEDLSIHVKKEHQERIIHCDSCDESFISNEEYISHRRLKHKETKSKERSYICDICNEQFRFVKDIIKHYSSVHSIEEKLVKPHSCNICSKRFRASTNLNNHKRYHEKTRMNICSMCGNSFKTKGDLIRHETLHLNERNHKCDKCGKAFKTMDNLRFHCLIVHTDQSTWKFVCHECGKRFPQKSGYEQHRKRHLGEKSFLCTRCDKAFITNNELQKHMFHHSNNMKYTCDQCGKEIKHKKSLEIHLARTHGIGDAKIPVRDRKHACDFCYAKFYDKSKLTRHIRIHTGVRPFSCFACNKKFNDNSYLKQHLKNFHQIIEDADGLNDQT